MIIKPNMTKKEMILGMVDEIFKGPSSTLRKIQALIKIRRESPFDNDIQNKCNYYLDTLYIIRYNSGVIVNE